MSVLAIEMKGDYENHQTAKMMYHLGNRIHGRGQNQRFHFRDHFKERFFIKFEQRNDFQNEHVSWDDYNWFIMKTRGVSVTKWQESDAKWDSPAFFQ